MLKLIGILVLIMLYQLLIFEILRRHCKQKNISAKEFFSTISTTTQLLIMILLLPSLIFDEILKVFKRRDANDAN